MAPPFFRSEQRLKNGGVVVLAVRFNIDEDLVDLSVFDIADINDAYKKKSALKLINQLNGDFRYSKFTLEDTGSITSSYSIMFEDNFNPKIVVRQLLLALNSVEEIYPKFMKIAWA